MSLMEEMNAPAADQLAKVRSENAAREALAQQVRLDMLKGSADGSGVMPKGASQEVTSVANHVRNTGEIPVITAGMPNPDQAPAQPVQAQGEQQPPVAN